MEPSEFGAVVFSTAPRFEPVAPRPGPDRHPLDGHVGRAHRQHVERDLGAGAAESPHPAEEVGHRADPPAVDDDLESALSLMSETGEEHVAVVEDTDSMKFPGCVHHREVMAAYNRALIQSHHEERGEGVLSGGRRTWAVALKGVRSQPSSGFIFEELGATRREFSRHPASLPDWTRPGNFQHRISLPRTRSRELRPDA